MAQSISTSFVRFAADEGEEIALQVAQDYQGALEGLMEISSEYEQTLVLEILSRVNLSIESINNKGLVAAVRKIDENGGDTNRLQF